MFGWERTGKTTISWSVRRVRISKLLSAKNEMKEILAGFRAGADDYLTKPIDARQLKARLVIAERILDLQHRMGSALEVSQGERLPVLASMRRAR
jgi:DNA-binding response OmpR family regulator